MSNVTEYKSPVIKVTVPLIISTSIFSPSMFPRMASSLIFNVYTHGKNGVVKVKNVKTPSLPMILALVIEKATAVKILVLGYTFALA